ncbi:MAG: oligosaccharide flippase family protein [Crocinitomicaceae bacterium]|jgi:O-antigen/teichoic acid export membrane protein|nr:oligosaccharide flippase family protein [Crocinitomicaceae bacterium]
MQRKFVSNLALVLVLNLLVKPVSLFWIDAGVQNRVPAEDYGMFYVLLNLTVFFNIILDLGINNFTTKNIAQYPHLAARYIGKVLSFRIAIFAAYLVITIPFAFLLDMSPKEQYLFGFLLFNQFIIGMIAYARSHFAGLLLFRWDALLSVLDRGILILTCGTLFFIHPEGFKIEWFVYLMTAAYLLTFFIAYGLLIRQIGQPKWAWDKVFIIAIVKKSLPYALLILLMMLYTRQDTFMLAVLHHDGEREVALYAMGYRILDAFFMFSMLFTGLLLPLFSSQIHNKLENLKLITLALKLLVGGALLLAWVSFFHAEEILSWLYHKDLQESGEIFKYLMLTFSFIALAIINSTMLTAFGEMKKLNQLALFSLVLNFALNYWLIPSYGGKGAAWATLATQIFISLTQYLLCWRYFGKNAFTAMSLQFMGLIILFTGVSLLIDTANYPILAQIAFAVAALLLLQIWKPREWLSFFKKMQNNEVESPQLEQNV